MQGTPQQEPARARPQIAVPATAGPTEGAAPTDPNAPVRMIYGTTVNVAESVETFKRFIRTFTLADKFRAMTEEDPTKRFDILPDHEEPLYPRLLAQVRSFLIIFVGCLFEIVRLNIYSSYSINSSSTAQSRRSL